MKTAAHGIAKLVGVRLRNGHWRHDVLRSERSDDIGGRVHDAVKADVNWCLQHDEMAIMHGYKGDSSLLTYVHKDGSKYVCTEFGTWGELTAT